MDGSLTNDRIVELAEKHSSQGLLCGTLTFLMTDIEGSTRLWEQYPYQMRDTMSRHDTLIESVVDQNGGLVVRPRGEGDSRFAVFPRATDALIAAIAIQRLFRVEPWKIPAPSVRMALHTGEACLYDGDYYGNPVNRCAHMRSAAHGGQILVSETTQALVRDGLPAGFSFSDLGQYHLKGLERPERIFQVMVADLPAEFPPIRTPDRIYNNLPSALTSFIGREREIEELEGLLSHSRLLTISGTGGAGKTRLAIQVAQDVKASFPDGVWLFDLAPLTNPALIGSYMMKVLGMREEAGLTPNQTFLANLQNKSMLLILDNCEHLLPGVAELAETLLRSAPAVRILATSREKLGAAGEVLWRIPSLSTPDASKAIPLDELLKTESVKLFLDRAATSRPGFTISSENAGDVAQICTRLDGIPLAIELAAARVRVLSPREIAAHLDDRFRLLVGNRTALPRQQTLRALMDWSYDLLSPQEQLLLRRLAVFSGGWTLEAAEQVTSGGAIEERDVLDLLTGLIDKSFVIGDVRNGHERYLFLETILRFSQERLGESGEKEVVAQKHAAYFRKMTVDSYGKEWGTEQVPWLMWLDEENDNLCAGLEWLSRSEGNEERLLELAGSLWRYWEIRGYFTKGRAWLEAALSKSDQKSGYWRANGLGGAGHLARQQGDYQRAQALHEQSLAIFRELDCQMGIARQLNALGEIARYLGDYPRSVLLHEESLAIRSQIGDKEGIAVSLRQLGVIARDRGQSERARELLQESLKLVRELGDQLLIALSLNELGLVAYHTSDYGRAEALFKEAAGFLRGLNDRLGFSNSLQNLGNVAKDLGDLKRAEQLFQECQTIKVEIGDKRGIAAVTASLAEVAFLQGKYPLAAELAGQSLALSRSLGFKRGILSSLIVTGFTAHYQGNFEQAALLAEESLALSLEIDAPRGTGYARMLLALGQYAQGKLAEAKEQYLAALGIFGRINSRRDMALVYINLARAAYRQGDHNSARHYLEHSLSTSKELNTRWHLAFVLEIMGLLQRSEANFMLSLELFRESLDLSLEQDNRQGIANCLGALAGLAVLANQPSRAAQLFAAASRLRREMKARMSNNDLLEYEHYLALVHEHMDHVAFEVEWTEGFTMSTDQVIEELKHWSVEFEGNEKGSSGENFTSVKESLY